MKYLLLLLSAFSFHLAKAQTAEVFESPANNGICLSKIVLYSDNQFFYSSVCGASSRISFGNWVKKKDSIKLAAVNPQTFRVIKSVEAKTIKSDSVWITVLDKDGKNLTAQISIGLDVPGRGSYMYGLDSTGSKKFVYKRSGAKIVFRTLNKLFSQRLDIPIDSANVFTVTLNISSDWINSTHPDWADAASLSFLKKGDGLTGTKIPHQVFVKKQ